MKSQQKIYCSIVLFFMGSLFIQAQSNTTDKKPTALKVYHQLSDVVNPDHVTWSKIVWEYIDLTIPENSDLMLNINAASGEDMQQSLFDFLVQEVNTNKKIEVFTNSFFTERMTPNQVKTKLTSVRKKGEFTDTYTVKTEDVYGFMIKGFWYFDKVESKVRYKLLGIAPMGPDIQTTGVLGIDDDNLYELFWVYYPAFRKDIDKVTVFNGNSQAQKIPLDYYLSKRQFKAERIDEISINNSTAPFSNSRKGLFQLKVNTVQNDSLLVKKVDSFWYKKVLTKEELDALKLKEILEKNKAFRKKKRSEKELQNAKKHYIQKSNLEKDSIENTKIRKIKIIM